MNVKITKEMIAHAPRTGDVRFAVKRDVFGLEFLALEIEVGVKIPDDAIMPTKLITKKFWRRAHSRDLPAVKLG